MLPESMAPHNSSSEIQLLDEIQQFLQSAVHDLRAAQRRTGIAAELLLQPATDQERSELTAQLLQGLSKSDELLIGIGNYATALTPSRYSFNVFPCNRAVRFAIATLDPMIRKTGATVTVADLPEISGDRDRLTEVFEHLIGNSLKFRGADPPIIEINAHRTSEGWLFTVKDNGVGIPGKYRDRIFIPFRRLHGAEIAGTGLGLAISKKIVEAHGGRIWIDPVEGPGLTLAFTLAAIDGD
jgi:light-regulated signal transduction histidine kinase (bacteriophytochrome)